MLSVPSSPLFEELDHPPGFLDDTQLSRYRQRQNIAKVLIMREYNIAMVLGILENVKILRIHRPDVTAVSRLNVRLDQKWTPLGRQIHIYQNMH